MLSVTTFNFNSNFKLIYLIFQTGLIFHKTQVLEVLPLSTRLQRLYSTSVYRRSNELITIAPHIIRLADPIPPFAQDGGCLLDRPEVLNVTRIKSQDSSHIHSSEQIIARETDDKSLELAVFLDEKAYRYFMSYFDNNLSSLRYLILAYMNGVSDSSAQSPVCTSVPCYL